LSGCGSSSREARTQYSENELGFRCTLNQLFFPSRSSWGLVGSLMRSQSWPSSFLNPETQTMCPPFLLVDRRVYSTTGLLLRIASSSGAKRFSTLSGSVPIVSRAVRCR